MKRFPFYLLFFPILLSSKCSSSQAEDYKKLTEQELANYHTAYFASGCFWCVEAIYESVSGVAEAVSGYAGGSETNPTYESVAGGSTSHSETVQVFYDPAVISFETLVKVYYASQNPTTVNGQHPDFGPQYRSIIFYSSDEEKIIAEKAKTALAESGEYKKPIATEITKFEKFYTAEDYHQDFERRNPNQGYIKAVSIPRLKRFQKKHPELLK